MQQADEVAEADRQLDVLRDELLAFMEVESAYDGTMSFELGSLDGGTERVVDPQVEFRSPFIEGVHDLRRSNGYREVAVSFMDGEVVTFRPGDVEKAKTVGASLTVRLSDGRAVRITHE